MKCPECLFENDERASKCRYCGYKFVTDESHPGREAGYFGQYFGFRKLITPALIVASHVLGAFAITLLSVVAMIFPEIFTPYGDDSSRIVFGGILFLVAGNLVWRMMCEGAILLFSLHETLVSLDDKARSLCTAGERYQPR
jgi:hypothetical protein